MRGRPLVIAATGDDAEDARVAAIARALGVPVNVPDKPALCSFVMPAIVDRGEVTVAIGTEGTSPVLAQRLRAWLEHELHPRLDALARLAGDFRDAVAETAPGGTPAAQILGRRVRRRRKRSSARRRRQRSAPPGGEAIEAAAKAQALQGRVLLVGAGPGDPELLTLKAVRALKQADVILYDRLAGTGVLEHARREVELIPGRQGEGRAQRPARQDSSADDRAGAREDKPWCGSKAAILWCSAAPARKSPRCAHAGIDVEIISGITAGLAAAASLQIPLTHRDISHSVTFISGHEAGGDEPSFEHLDLAALGKGESTLLVYMGVSTAGLIAHRLLDAGWKPECPVIAVENASRDSERRVATTLAELAASPERLELKSPAVLIFGEVAGLPASGLVEDVLS